MTESEQIVAAETQKARYVFRATQYPDGTPWILFEPYDHDLPILEGRPGEPHPLAFLGFDLRRDTTYDKAREIAAYLNDHVDLVTCTLFKAG